MITLDFSILICTYNRADYIGSAIESCLDQTLEAKQYEIIVVDNNSTDHTREIVGNYQSHSPRIRYIVEEQQGLNFARNRGAREAWANRIAYLDDDAVANRDWLESLLNAFQENVHQPVCVGGRVCLDWEGDRPEWFPTDYESLMASVDHGSRGFLLDRSREGDFLIGTNMAFSRSTVLNMGGFRTAYGRKKRRNVSAAETELINRLLAKHLPVYYEPEAKVTHTVVPERRTRRFLFDRVRGDGMTQPLVDLDSERFCRTNIAQRIVYDAKECGQYLLSGLLSTFRGAPEEAFLKMLKATQKMGRTEMELRFLFDPEFRPLWTNRFERLKQVQEA